MQRHFDQPAAANTYHKLVGMVEEIDERGRGLTEWEVKFIAQFVDNPHLLRRASKRQAECINDIWQKRVH